MHRAPNIAHTDALYTKHCTLWCIEHQTLHTLMHCAPLSPHTFVANFEMHLKPPFSSKYISQCILRNEDLVEANQLFSAISAREPCALLGFFAVNRYQLTLEPTLSALPCKFQKTHLSRYLSRYLRRFTNNKFPGRASNLLWVRYFELFLDLIGFQHPSIGAFYWGDRVRLVRVGNLGGHWSSIKDDADASPSRPDHDPNPWRHHQTSSMETSVLLSIESWGGWHQGSFNLSDASIGYMIRQGTLGGS